MKHVAGKLFAAGCIAALCFSAYFLAKTRAETLAAALPVAERSAVVASGGSAEASAPESGVARTAARIAPEPGEQVLDTIDANLDDDEELEQVLTVRKPGASDEAIHVVVVDFQPSTGVWHRLWSGATLAKKPAAFAIQVMDLVGDGSSELLCFGPDASGHQTLTVFKRMYGRNGQAFESIFSESAESIDIDESDQQFGESSPIPVRGRPESSLSISVSRAVQNSENPLDRIRTVYRWNRSAKRYKPEESASIPGGVIERDLTAKILTGDAQDFATYIDGAWISRTDKGSALIDFDPDEGKISFHSEEADQVWKWSASSPSVSGILAATINDSLPELLRLVDVQLIGPDRLRVRVLDEQVLRLGDRNIWNGDYSRVAANQPAERVSAMTPIRPDVIEGCWMSEDGKLFEFEGSRFRAGGILPAKQGGLSLFDFNGTLLLDLLPVDEDGIPQEPLRYMLLFADDREQIRLKPIALKSDGATILYAPELVLRKLQKDRMEKLQSAG